MDSLFDYFSHAGAAYAEIVSTLKKTKIAFEYTPQGDSSATIAVGKISKIMKVITKQTKKMETTFLTLNGVEQALSQEIGNQSVSVFGQWKNVLIT